MQWIAQSFKWNDIYLFVFMYSRCNTTHFRSVTCFHVEALRIEFWYPCTSLVSFLRPRVAVLASIVLHPSMWLLGLRCFRLGVRFDALSHAGVEGLNGGLTSREPSLCYSRKGFRKQIFKPLRDSLRSGFSSLPPKGRIRHIKCTFHPQISAMWKKFTCEWHVAKIYVCFARENARFDLFAEVLPFTCIWGESAFYALKQPFRHASWKCAKWLFQIFSASCQIFHIKWLQSAKRRHVRHFLNVVFSPRALF